MRKPITILAALFAAMAIKADTYTWTGNENSSDYATAGNWNVGDTTATHAFLRHFDL